MFYVKGLSWKFCSAENFGPGPIFSEKIVPPRMNFPEKRAGAENFVPLYSLLKNDCKKLYDARRGRSAQNEAQNNCLIVNATMIVIILFSVKLFGSTNAFLAICLLK